MKLKILAIVVLAAVGVGAAFVAVGGLPASAADTSEYLTGAATTGDVADEVAATGTVATSASYGLAFGAPAHLAGDDAAAGATTWPVTDVKVAVGDTVKKGDVLATADTTDLKRQLAAANTAVDTARIQLRMANASLSDAKDADVTDADPPGQDLGQQCEDPAVGSARHARRPEGPDQAGHPDRPDRRRRHRGQRGRRDSTRRRATRSSSTPRPSRSRPTWSRATSPR